MPRRLFVLLAALLIGPTAAGCQAAVHAQGATSAVFPDVQTRPIRYAQAAIDAADRPDGPHAPAGQEGFGRTVLEVAGTAEDDAALTLRIYAKLDGAPAGTMNGIAYAGGATALDLSQLAERAGENRFTAQLSADNAFGAVARTQWVSGASSAYEAPSTAGTLLLPFMAVNTGTQSSVLAAQNAGTGTIQVSIEASDPVSGDTLISTQVSLSANEGVEWDTAVERFIFDPSLLLPNAGGGFIGPLRLSTGGPVAMIGYLDETAGPATAAIVARPVSAAATVQILPRVRSASDGGSLIAIANASRTPVQAVLRLAAQAGGSGAPAERNHTIPGNGAWYIDLSPGGRSLPSAAPGAPFVGSATITASGPILAAALEDWRAGGAVDAMAGYNAFGPRDLSDRWAIPRVRRATDFVSSLIIVHNPTAGHASGSLQLADAQGAPGVVIDLEIPAGTSTSVDLSDEGNFPVGTGSAMLQAGAPVAVVAYELRDTSREYPLRPLDVEIQDERNSGIEGMALLTPDGADLRVEIDLAASGSATTYAAYIMKSACTEQDSPAAYPLSDVVARRSTTTLAGLDLRTVADGYHAIRLKRAGGGPFAGRVACGMIGQVRGVEVADSSAVRGIPLSAGPDVIPTAAPTGIATTPQPTRESTPVPTVRQPTIAPTPGIWVASVFMPMGYAGP